MITTIVLLLGPMQFPPEWVVLATENNDVWRDSSDKRTPQEKVKVALLEYMTRYVRTDQTKRRKEATP